MTQSKLADYQSLGSGFECGVCEQVFETSRGLSAHKWQSHDESSKVEVECDNCGDTVLKYPNRVFDTNFCNSDCQYSYQSGENHQNAVERVEIDCSECGTTLVRAERNIGDRAFCNHECYGAWMAANKVGPDHPQWSREEVPCANCGEHIWRKQHQIDGRRYFCSVACEAEWKSKNVYGDSHPSWRGGRETINAVRRAIGDESWKKTAERARENADGECEMCGKPTDYKLHAHHFIPISAGGVNADELLLALCRGCHKTAEAYLQPLFDPLLTTGPTNDLIPDPL